MKIDEEFKSLIPPLTDEEKRGLKESLLSEGCRDALVLWGDILIDGHNRYEICIQYDIPFKTIQMEFTNRDEVKLWMMKNQLARRNLNTFQRMEIVEKFKPVIAKQAQKRQKAGKADLDQIFDQGRTSKKLAELAGTSHETAHKAEKIINEAPEPIKATVRDGVMSISQAYEVTKMKPEVQQEIIDRIESGEEPKQAVKEARKPFVVNNSHFNEWYTPAHIVEAARRVMGSIDTDPASSDMANKTVQASTYYTAETNGLDKTWTGNVWMNPPYSNGLMEKFINKLEMERPNYTQAIVIVNNATETGWFSTLAGLSSCVCFLKGRTRFIRPNEDDKGAPLQGQVILYIGENVDSFVFEFFKLGKVAKFV